MIWKVFSFCFLGYGNGAKASRGNATMNFKKKKGGDMLKKRRFSDESAKFVWESCI